MQNNAPGHTQQKIEITQRYGFYGFVPTKNNKNPWGGFAGPDLDTKELGVTGVTQLIVMAHPAPKLGGCGAEGQPARPPPSGISVVLAGAVNSPRPGGGAPPPGRPRAGISLIVHWQNVAPRPLPQLECPLCGPAGA